MQDPKSRQKSPSGHHRTNLSGYIFATKAHIDNRKKLVKQQYLLHMSSQYGELRPTSGWDRFVSLGHPCNFNGFRVLAALLHSIPVAGVSQTLRRWPEGATYIRQGGHHVGHWPTFLVIFSNNRHVLLRYTQCRMIITPLAYLMNCMSKLHGIASTFYSGPWLGQPMTTVKYIMYFSFCGWPHVFPLRAL